MSSEYRGFWLKYMKKETLNFRFKKFQNKDTGDIISLAQSVGGMHYPKQQINDAFRKYVSQDQYDKCDRDDLITWLWGRSASNDKPKEIPKRIITEK